MSTVLRSRNCGLHRRTKVLWVNCSFKNSKKYWVLHQNWNRVKADRWACTDTGHIVWGFSQPQLFLYSAYFDDSHLIGTQQRWDPICHASPITHYMTLLHHNPGCLVAASGKSFFPFLSARSNEIHRFVSGQSAPSSPTFLSALLQFKTCVVLIICQ